MIKSIIGFFKKPKLILRVRKCPFCDSDQLLIRAFEDSGLFYVNCARCGSKGPMADGEIESIKRWNKVARNG